MARLVSEGRKKEFAAFGWEPESIPDPESKDTFERSKLKWDEPSKAEHAEMLEWYRTLIRLRRSTPCLNNGEAGNINVDFEEAENWLRFDRGEVSVFCNLGSHSRDFEVAGGTLILLASREGARREGTSLTVPANAVVVARQVRTS